MTALRKLLNLIRDSLWNMLRHPLVTVASLTTVTLMLVLLGAFTTVSLLANHSARVIAQQPPVEVWCSNELRPEESAAIEAYLEGDQNVLSWKRLTPLENYELLRAGMGESAKALDSFPFEKLQYTFQVRLVNPEEVDAFTAQIRAYPGVQNVDVAERTMRTLNSIVRVVNTATLIAFAIMCIVSLFIISNMVRISVLARSEEIAIMKYVGATKLYIRTPYVLEGALIGTVGALLAFAAIYFSYDKLYTSMVGRVVGDAQSSPFTASNMMLPLPSIAWRVLVINLVLGILIGAAGSALSVRRHIQV